MSPEREPREPNLNEELNQVGREIIKEINEMVNKASESDDADYKKRMLHHLKGIEEKSKTRPGGALDD